MFGSGNGQDAPVAQDTGSLWGEMFGMGSLFKIITDPALMTHTHAMMSAVIEGANANRRIEAKLDLLLKSLGQEIETINGRWPSHLAGPPALLEANRTDGARGSAPASSAVDNGSGALAGAIGAIERKLEGDG